MKRTSKESAALGRIRAGCHSLLACLLLAGTAQAGQPPAETTPVVGGLLVGVLPFVNTSGGEVDRWIGAGIAETIASDLSRLPGVRVVGREVLGVQDSSTGADPVGGDDRVAVDVFRDLGARWLIDGSYQRVGDRLRIIARLVDVETGTAVHTAKKDGTVSELFDLQDQVVAELGVHLGVRQPSSDRVAAAGEVSEGGASAAPRSVSPPSADETQRPASGVAAPAIDNVATPSPEPSRPLAAGFERPAFAILGPPPPVPPATVSRDAAGRATVRAVRVPTLRVDGILDESVYDEVEALTDFVQQEPLQGAPATEKTEAWVLFDDDNFYLSARSWDSAPESQWILNEMRRDNNNISFNEAIFMFLDPFYDRRNGHMFIINALGGRQDAQTTDERTYDGDWNTIWEARTGRFDGGWTLEVAIPFKSLRYRPGREQIWGINIRRYVRWKSELSALTPLDPARGLPAIFQASQAATLVGLEAPSGGSGRTLEVKPYAISEVASTRNGSPTLSNDAAGDVGIDLKYGVTQGLAADLTVNTDFAQVEADEQQVNLTRFSLFFPEKREFFLENQGIFIFGGARSGSFRGGGVDTPVLFFSREIGLDQGREVPIDVGGRLTGRVGRFRVGAMNIRTGDVSEIGTPVTNFTVARLRRDVLRRSNVGLLFTNRSVSKTGTGSSQTYGVDGIFSFFNNLNVNTYWSKTSTPAGLGSDEVSYRAQLDYNADRYGVQAERLVVGADFNPEVGFARRAAFDRRFGLFRFSPRSSIAAVRKLSYQGQVAYVLDRAGVLETRESQGSFGIELENSDMVNASYTDSYELLKAPFRIAPGVTIPVGGYNFRNAQASFTLGQTRRLGGTFSVERGSFFSGDKTTVGFSRGRLELTPQFSVEPGVSYNRVDLPEGRFTTNLVSTRTTYTVSPLMFVSALLQFNSSNDSLTTNVRLRWEYQPGSELFVVYNEQRDTLVPTRLPQLENRAFIVKINRLLRF